MDERTCRNRSGTQLVEKNRAFCEKIVNGLSGKQDLLDQALDAFTEEGVREAAEQLQTLLKELHSRPSEMMQEHIPSFDTIIQGLQNTLIELTLALDQLSPPENKASFYKHILASQACFADIFTHDLIKASERVYAQADTAPATILTFSPRHLSLLNFSQTILPAIYTLIRNSGSTCSTQYEQAIMNLQILEEIIEKQKKLLKLPQHIDNNECILLRCRLGVILAYASELLRQLIHSLSTLRTQSRSKSRKTAQLREEALYSLTLFIHNFDDILQKTQELTLLQSQERFQHRDADPTLKKIISLRR